MSTREPMWYCHGCHAEMRPLMVPDPVCASCHGSFVEKIEDPSNDPREFATGGGPGDVGELDGLDTFLMGLQALLNRGTQQNQQPSSSTDQPSQRPQPSSRLTFQVRSTSGPRQTSFTIGTSSPPTVPPGSPPTMSEFLRSTGPPNNHDDGSGNRDTPSISGPLFAQYLLSLLGQTDHPLLPMFVGGMPDSGRMGDYVFSQEALDQIITQIMENSNSHRPVPATEEIMQNLPREVLKEGSPLLSKDCAVCKDQFQLGTEDPDEQLVVQLPCKHPFHQSCILPWLKSSGTCPVCRYALVPQPDHNAPRNNATSPASSSMPTSTSSPFGAGGNPFNHSSSHSSAPRARSQSPPFGRRSTRSGGGSTPESHTGTGLFTQLFRNLAGAHDHRSHETSPSPPNATPFSTSPSAPSPTYSPFGPASGPTRTRDPSRRYMYRSSMDSSIPFIQRSSTPRSQSHSQSQQRNQSSDGGGGGSGSRTQGGRTQGGRPHVPGEWSDDFTDLD